MGTSASVRGDPRNVVAEPERSARIGPRYAPAYSRNQPGQLPLSSKNSSK